MQVTDSGMTYKFFNSHSIMCRNVSTPVQFSIHNVDMTGIHGWIILDWHNNICDVIWENPSHVAKGETAK